LITDGLFDTTYGRVEFNAKLPSWVGTWPLSGEINVMEHVGHDHNVVHGTVDTGDYNHILGT
jgi:beta-glucanase (GH16 family)